MDKINIIVTICICICIYPVSSRDQERKVYIAYMGSLPQGEYSAASHHSQIIREIVDPIFSSKSLVRSYMRSFNGFSAYLSEDEREKLTRIPGVISVFPCQKSKLQTTRSWDFMGLSTTTERRPAVESDIIVGIIDTGIWPESESFSDEGFGPVPTKWKGSCDGGVDFVCNRKIIGARYYSTLSARDTDGHGTHVASTLAGNHVHANYYGLADGIARGGVPSARLAIYKACDEGCPDTNILSAFDHAIADGVDIISVSIGHGDQLELTRDPIAIGAFHAIERGILTVAAAGNDGPSLFTVDSYAPWIFTVAASEIDRKFVDKLLLGKDTVLVGNAINAFPTNGEATPLVYGEDITNNCSEVDARNCLEKCLEATLVNQKVVLCDRMPNLTEVFVYGAAGCIYPQVSDSSMVMPFSAVGLNINDLNLVKSYKYSTREPQVHIYRSEAIDNQRAPYVASFSSRGPSIYMHDIIKPDIIAPGVEILAAFSPLGSPSSFPSDTNSVKFNILSGTSMACPHVSAAAAFVKSFHPDWSPSAVKSALMTTAWKFNTSLNPEAEFAYGSGHINPLKATDPGLVYETSIQEYLKIWCNISRTLGSMIPTGDSCPMKFTHKEINYPSMAAEVEARDAFSVSFPRTVTNVGQANSTYVAYIEGHTSKLDISVEPNTLQFTRVNMKKDYVVTIRGKIMKPHTIKRMSLLWTDGDHQVRSPIVVYTISIGGKTPTPSGCHIMFVLVLILIIPFY